ncbi:hypothetical protein [Thermoleptolyngbya sp.]
MTSNAGYIETGAIALVQNLALHFHATADRLRTASSPDLSIFLSACFELLYA